MDIDAIMDTAITAARDVFGRAVSYVPPGGGAAVSIVADFQRSAQTQSTGQTVEASTYAPVLDCREADFTEAGIVPEMGALVTLTVEGVEQTFEVVDITPVAVGTVHLQLGRRR